jgi:hypothetical protein
MKSTLTLAALFLLSTYIPGAGAQTPPPAPTLVEPANGASLAQPMTLRWTSVVDPDGPIGSYTWQVATTSAFTLVIASGFTDARSGDVIPTVARLSGVPNGTYFLRVKATQIVGGAVFSIDSAWSAVRTFTLTGLGPAPGTPSFSSPGTGSRFHPYEFFDIKWTSVPGAQYYLLEADDEPNFSYPITLSVDPMQFGTLSHAGWGNEIANIYYRVRAVSVDNVRGLPSPALNVKIVNMAPVPAAPALRSPIGGATVSLPFTFDWSDTANPQIPGYDLDVDDEPNFLGDFGVLLVQNISRSDYTLVSDLAPGTYFWRVRALHGLVAGPWSAGGSFRVVASPPTPPGLDLFWLITEPGSVSGGHPTQARVTLNGPAPSGGATVRIASDMPHVEVPENVFIPAGSTDAVVSPVTTVPMNPGMVGTLRAAYGGGWQQSSLGIFPMLFSLSLNTDSVVGGGTVTGTVTLKRAAPAGGVEVSLVSDDTSLARPPARVVVAEGETAASFSIPTSPVSQPTKIVFNTGTANDGYRAPETWLMLRPAGLPAPAPSLSSVRLASSSVLGGGTTTGTVTLTGPAPAGGAPVWVNGSMEGQVVTPAGGVMVPAGSTSATFTINAPDVNFSNWVIIQASYGNGAGMHGAVLRIDPGAPAIPSVLAMTVQPVSTIGGGSLRGTVGLETPAPPGGATVFLSSDNPVARVPPSVNIAAGNSATTFTVSTTAVSEFNSASITATAGSTSKTAFISVFPDPNGGTALSSITPSVSGTTGGNTINATLFLSANAPAGGAAVTLSTSNISAARVPPIVTVPAGLGFASFTITTLPVASDTTVTITGTYGTTRTATITVLGGSNDTTRPTVAISSPASGATVSGTTTISATASDNVGVTRVQFLLDGAVLSTDTSSPYSFAWNTATAANGSHSLTARAFDAANNQTTSTAVSVTVSNAAPAPASLDLAMTGVPATIRRGQRFTVTATATNTGTSSASGYSVAIAFSPSDAMRRENPSGTSQSLAAIAAGSSRSVSWQIRADRSGSATLTMTLRDASGATVRTVSQAVVITN